MIVEWLLQSFWGFLLWIAQHFPEFDLFTNEMTSTVVQYVARVIRYGGSMFYLLVPPTAFKAAIDVIFFWLIHDPAFKALMWVLKKIPFLSIS